MTQVSGSISLDLSKVARETTAAVIGEITRTVRTRDEEEQDLPTPMTKLADAVTDRVLLRLDRDLGGVLAEVRTGLARLEDLVRAEAERRDRLTNGPITGEFPVITPEDLTSTGEHPRYGPGQGPEWAPDERPAVANVGPYEVEVIES